MEPEDAGQPLLIKDYTMIRAKKIEYLDSPAIAIYFLNMNEHVN